MKIFILVDSLPFETLPNKYGSVNHKTTILIKSSVAMLFVAIFAVTEMFEELFIWYLYKIYASKKILKASILHPLKSETFQSTKKLLVFKT